MPPTVGPSWLRSRRAAVIAAIVAAVVVAGVLIGVFVGGGSDDDRRSARSDGPSPSGSGSGSSSLAAPSGSATVPSFSPPAKPSAAQLALLKGRVGFGGQVTGGAGGELVHVDTDAESGSGSLREALSGNDARWIVFDKDMTIKITSALTVGSNKTIDARGHQVEITGPGVDGLDIVNVSNVVVEGLTLHDFGNVAKTKQNDKFDAIHLDGAKGVWIDHNDLSMAGDKLIAVSNGSSGVTVSWNHLHDQEQAFQIGNQATAQADTAQTVTVDHNFFDRTGYRNPVISYGRAHVFNNYYYDWKTYAVRSERAAQLYLQSNVFAAGSNPRAVIVKPGGDGCNDANTRCDTRNGSLAIQGNLLLDGAKIKNSYVAGTVFKPDQFYRYTAQPASKTLAASIARYAGPQK